MESLHGRKHSFALLGVGWLLERATNGIEGVGSLFYRLYGVAN